MLGTHVGDEISFMNDIANCVRRGADVNPVRKGIGSDPDQQVHLGMGYGGLFPKSFGTYGPRNGHHAVRSCRGSERRSEECAVRRQRLLRVQLQGKTVLGLSLGEYGRHAHAVYRIGEPLLKRCDVRAYDLVLGGGKHGWAIHTYCESDG